jgi:hypothetical protein
MAEVTVSKCNEEELVNSQEQTKILDDAAIIKMKRLLKELESAFTIATPMIPKPNCLGFEIEVLDETALLDCIPKNGKQQSRRKPSKNTVPEKKKKKKRRRKKKKKKKYSRVTMESLRFVNVSQQHKFWKKIHAALQSAFADEYDTLEVAAALNNRHALPFLPIKKLTTNSHWSVLFSSLQFILYYYMDIKSCSLLVTLFVFIACIIILDLLSATIGFLFLLVLEPSFVHCAN